jgi:double-stranded uracil-DNA glycosylase
MILPDYLVDALDVVFCGTAAGDRSALHGHYYAGPGNRFWQMLSDTGLTPKLLTPEDDSLVTQYGIGLTDLVKHHSGSDSSLRREMYDVTEFERKVVRHAPRLIAFNGKAGAAAFLGLATTKLVSIGLQNQMIGKARIYVLPSTSGNARAHWDQKPWHELAGLIGSRAVP